MRIALLSYRSKTHCGGQGVYVRHLSRGLVELGHDVPRPSEIRDSIDLLELLTVWTAGFPEPRTFTLRAARLLADRVNDFDLVHDNQSLGTGLLTIADAGLPVVATVHHPITRDRVLDVAAAKWWRKP